MRKIVIIMFFILCLNTFGKVDYIPGLEYLGKGYNLFDGYANPSSVKEGLFRLTNFKLIEFQEETYQYPKQVLLKELDEKKTREITVVSKGEYVLTKAKSLGFNEKTMFFEKEINKRFPYVEEEYEKYYIKNIEETHNKLRLNLDGDLKNHKRYLKKYARLDINNLSVTAKFIYDKYGSHYLAEVFMGGKINYDLSISHFGGLSKNDLEKIYLASHNREELSEELKKKIIKLSSKFNFYGGNRDFYAMDKYEEWLESLNKKIAFSEIREKGLIPIWNLCDTEERKNQLKDYYESLVKEKALKKLNNNFDFAKLEEDKAYELNLNEKTIDVPEKDGAWALMKGPAIQINKKTSRATLDRVVYFEIVNKDKGEYLIIPGHSYLNDSKTAWDLESARETDGARVVLWDKHGKENQVFIIMEQDGKFIIRNKKSRKLICVNEEKIDLNKAKLRQYLKASKKANNFKWDIKESNEEYLEMNEWYLKNSYSKKYMGIRGKSKKDGAIVHLWQFNNGNHQKIKFIPSEDMSYYYIKFQETKDLNLGIKLEEILNSSMASKFLLKYVENDEFILESKNSKVLGAYKSKKNGIKITLNDFNYELWNKWELYTKRGNDFYKLKANGKLEKQEN